MEELTRTDRTQLAMLTCSVATWRCWREAGLSFVAAVGHSLGEYSALVAAGNMSFADALQVVEVRGLAMQACAEERGGTMAAVIGLETEVVEKMLRVVEEVWLANYNSPGSSGHLRLGRSGARGRRGGDSRRGQAGGAPPGLRGLPHAFHGRRRRDALAGPGEVSSGRVGAVLLHHRGAGSRSPSEMAEVLARQLMSPVKFSQSMERYWLAPTPPTAGLEVGPGSVLAGLMKRIARDLRSASTGTLSRFARDRDLTTREARDG